MDHKNFISILNGFVMAPAGHGKTHSITECLLHAEGRQLVLTHTHAGIASIKEKIRKLDANLDNYHIETITGYAQKYVLAYHTGRDIPSHEEADKYYDFIVKRASQILSWELVQKVIRVTYSELFVDEYQDCSLAQHDMILSLSKVLPTFVFGDPLQGIFSFKGQPMVDLEDQMHMAIFGHNKHLLATPWRWKGKNEQLGDTLNTIRNLIISKSPIDLRNHSSVEFINVSTEADLYNPSSEYYKSFSGFLKLDNLLIIHPESTSINPRKKIISLFKTPISLIESIDDKDFYKLAEVFDSTDADKMEYNITQVSLQLFNKTVINQWFNENGLKRKKDQADQLLSTNIKSKIVLAQQTGTKSMIADALNLISELKDVRCYRKELFIALCHALRDADANNVSVLESMEVQRNIVRGVGRKNYGRCIGTTLLTKGLEFENVIILDAHKFKCPKNLYVALTRASKKLIVFSRGPILQPQN